MVEQPRKALGCDVTRHKAEPCEAMWADESHGAGPQGARLRALWSVGDSGRRAASLCLAPASRGLVKLAGAKGKKISHSFKKGKQRKSN